jgi:hypothetical protein
MGEAGLVHFVRDQALSAIDTAPLNVLRHKLEPSTLPFRAYCALDMEQNQISWPIDWVLTFQLTTVATLPSGDSEGGLFAISAATEWTYILHSKHSQHCFPTLTTIETVEFEIQINCVFAIKRPFSHRPRAVQSHNPTNLTSWVIHRRTCRQIRP